MPGPDRLLAHEQRIAAVAGEHLVAAVAGQRHRHVPPRHPADDQVGMRRAVGERLAVDRARRSISASEALDLDPLLVMAGAVALRDLPRMGGLVEGRVAEADRAGGDRAGAGLRHQRDHAAGIDAARQEGAQRHVGHEASATASRSRAGQLVREIRDAAAVRLARRTRVASSGPGAGTGAPQRRSRG